METLLSILGYANATLFISAIVAIVVALFKDASIKKKLINIWLVVILTVNVVYFSCTYAVYYNKPANKICRNIENNHKNWSFHIDSTEYKKYSYSYISILKIINHNTPRCLENKNCGIKIMIRDYGYSISYEMISPVKYTFSEEEGENIFRTYEQPINEHFTRLMEPIRLVTQWKEKAKQDSIKETLNNTLNNCK